MDVFVPGDPVIGEGEKDEDRCGDERGAREPVPDLASRAKARWSRRVADPGRRVPRSAQCSVKTHAAYWAVGEALAFIPDRRLRRGGALCQAGTPKKPAHACSQPTLRQKLSDHLAGGEI